MISYNRLLVIDQMGTYTLQIRSCTYNPIVAIILSFFLNITFWEDYYGGTFKHLIPPLISLKKIDCEA